MTPAGPGRPGDAPWVVTLAAPAKVNLFLKILHRRGDGFHELETLFQAVDLCDRVTVAREGSGVALEVDGPDLGPLEENLAHRAARAFLHRVGARGGEGVRIRLEKRIPAGAGLGGGSSDAAAVLRCMNALWGAEEPGGGAIPGESLADLGAELNSDVPFFLGGSTLALGTGRGEILRPLRPLPSAHLVLVLPPVHVATGPAYVALARQRERRPEPAREAWDPASLAGGWDAAADAAVNDFETVVPDAYPEVAASLQALGEAGGAPVLLSGSGGACFGLFAGGTRAAAAAEGVAGSLGFPSLAVRTLEQWPAPEVVG